MDNKGLFYFILYLVVIVDILMVINERDLIEEEENKILNWTIHEIFKKPEIIGQSDFRFSLDDNSPKQIKFSTDNLISKDEIKNITYFLLDERDTVIAHTRGVNNSDFTIALDSITGSITLFLRNISNASAKSYKIFSAVDRQLKNILIGKDTVLYKPVKKQIDKINRDSKTTEATKVFIEQKIKSDLHKFTVTIYQGKVPPDIEVVVSVTTK